MTLKLNFDTDFTWCLVEPVQHTVKVVTSDGKTIHCSGAILGQHSSVLREHLQHHDEVYLDNYTNVNNCLNLLHGRAIILDLDNFEEIMKFLAEFGIYDLYQDCHDWIGKNLIEENFARIFKVCLKVRKMIHSLKSSYKFSDPLHHCYIYILFNGPGILENSDVYNSTDELKDVLKAIISQRLVGVCLNYITARTSADTVYVVLKLMGEVVFKLRCCSRQHITKFLDRVDEIAAVECKLPLDILKEYYKLKGSLTPSDCLSDVDLKAVILKEKLWKTIDKENICLIRRLFDGHGEHFIYTEILLQWLETQPWKSDEISEALSFIEPHKLSKHYIECVNRYTMSKYGVYIFSRHDILMSMKKDSFELTGTTINKSPLHRNRYAEITALIKFKCGCKSPITVVIPDNPETDITFSTPSSTNVASKCHQTLFIDWEPQFLFFCFLNVDDHDGVDKMVHLPFATDEETARARLRSAGLGKHVHLPLGSSNGIVLYSNITETL